jgi:hypothetical protein
MRANTSRRAVFQFTLPIRYAKALRLSRIEGQPQRFLQRFFGLFALSDVVALPQIAYGSFA